MSKDNTQLQTINNLDFSGDEVLARVIKEIKNLTEIPFLRLRVILFNDMQVSIIKNVEGFSGAYAGDDTFETAVLDKEGNFVGTVNNYQTPEQVRDLIIETAKLEGKVTPMVGGHRT